MSTLHQCGSHSGQAVALRWMTLNLSSVLMPITFGSWAWRLGVPVVFSDRRRVLSPAARALRGICGLRACRTLG